MPYDNHCSRRLPLQLIDQNSENQRGGCVFLDVRADSEDGQRGEKFSILGHSMNLKRQREDSSSPRYFPFLSPSKRALIDPDLETKTAIVRSWGNNPLHVADPAVHEITEKERHRQIKGIELIASANYFFRAVLHALGSHLADRYSEGMSGARYFAGNQYSDEIEGLCCERALAAFSLDPEYCGVNFPPYSSTSANFVVYTGLLLLKGSRSGGHVSHGYLTPSGKKVIRSILVL